MEVFLNRVDGIDDAIISMFLSKRTLTREMEMDIRNKTAAHSVMIFHMCKHRLRNFDNTTLTTA